MKTDIIILAVVIVLLVGNPLKGSSIWGAQNVPVVDEARMMRMNRG